MSLLLLMGGSHSGQFSPASISGLRGWWDTTVPSSVKNSSGVPISSGAVGQLDDISGNGYNLLQSEGGNQPDTGSNTINGENVLRFQATDRMNTENPVIDLAGGESMTIFHLTDSFTSVGTRFSIGQWGGDGTNRQFLFGFNTGNNLRLQAQGNFGSSAGVTSSLPSGTMVIACMKFTSSTDEWELLLNGVSEGTFTRTMVGSTNDILGFGSNGQGWNGVIGETAAYNRALDNDEISQLFTYFNGKYAVYS